MNKNERGIAVILFMPILVLGAILVRAMLIYQKDEADAAMEANPITMRFDGLPPHVVVHLVSDKRIDIECASGTLTDSGKPLAPGGRWEACVEHKIDLSDGQEICEAWLPKSHPCDWSHELAHCAGVKDPEADGYGCPEEKP
jgi:hypothetical protein